MNPSQRQYSPRGVRISLGLGISLENFRVQIWKGSDVRTNKIESHIYLIASNASFSPACKASLILFGSFPLP
jgi:hypothetical protein